MSIFCNSPRSSSTKHHKSPSNSVSFSCHKVCGLQLIKKTWNHILKIRKEITFFKVINNHVINKVLKDFTGRVKSHCFKAAFGSLNLRRFSFLHFATGFLVALSGKKCNFLSLLFASFWIWVRRPESRISFILFQFVNNLNFLQVCLLVSAVIPILVLSCCHLSSFNVYQLGFCSKSSAF